MEKKQWNRKREEMAPIFIFVIIWGLYFSCWALSPHPFSRSTPFTSGSHTPPCGFRLVGPLARRPVRPPQAQSRPSWPRSALSSGVWTIRSVWSMLMLRSPCCGHSGELLVLSSPTLVLQVALCNPLSFHHLPNKFLFCLSSPEAPTVACNQRTLPSTVKE